MANETPTLTLGRFLEELSPVLWKGLISPEFQVPIWPPDAFALVTAVMLHTGCYVEVLDAEWPPLVNAEAVVTVKSKKQETVRSKDQKEEWRDSIRLIGETWRSAWASGSSGGSDQGDVPGKIKEWWKLLLDNRAIALAGLASLKHQTPETENTIRSVRQSLLQIAAAADEACYDVGFPWKSKEQDQLAIACERKLSREHSFPDSDSLNDLAIRTSTLCVDIDVNRFRVLPKMRTPQSGMTIRNLSHNLTLYRTSEVLPCWNLIGNETEDGKTTFNLLLIPWPDNVLPSEFDSKQFAKTTHDGRFTYRRPSQLQQLLTRVEGLFKNALKRVPIIDGVVFPELSVKNEEYIEITNLLKSMSEENHLHPPFLIAGICDGSPDVHPNDLTNQVNILFPNKQGIWETELTQHKHHRWCLDRNQITRYGLSEQLDPSRIWWEAFPLKERELNFIAYSSNLLLSVLICEDLARPDPVADLVRAIGPNLVIALLMDGPQLADRWSARYAGVLADDPGSAVLTLTSLGMIQLSRKWDQERSPRVIGLWRDKYSSMQELALPETADALIINIGTRQDGTRQDGNELERTADGRFDRGGSTHLTLTGVHAISSKSDSH
jgi:hypothetical protein